MAGQGDAGEAERPADGREPGGVSPSSAQPSRIATTGIRYASEARRPALVRRRAYAQVAKPSAVGATPR